MILFLDEADAHGADHEVDARHQEHGRLAVADKMKDEAARGRGVGRALYEHILAYARQIGCYNVTLNVWICNPGAMAFYEKLGLVPYRIGMEQIL